MNFHHRCSMKNFIWDTSASDMNLNLICEVHSSVPYRISILLYQSAVEYKFQVLFAILSIAKAEHYSGKNQTKTKLGFYWVFIYTIWKLGVCIVHTNLVLIYSMNQSCPYLWLPDTGNRNFLKVVHMGAVAGRMDQALAHLVKCSPHSAVKCRC